MDELPDGYVTQTTGEKDGDGSCFLGPLVMLARNKWVPSIRVVGCTVSLLFQSLFGVSAFGISALSANPAFGAASTPADDPTIRFQWKGDSYDFGEIDPRLLEEAPDRALSAWSEWASTAGYCGFLSEDGRVLLLMSRSDIKRGSKNLELTEEILGYLESTFAPAPPKDTTEESESSDHGSAQDSPMRKVRAESGDEAANATIRETAVLIEFEDPRDLDSALDAMAKMYPHIRGVLENHRNQTGFTQWGPLVAGWLKSASGVEEWHPKHELINRATQLLMIQRYLAQPIWTTLGLAWHVEFKFTGKIHCFPYRDEFVAIGEHAGYEGPLKKLFSKRKKDPPSIHEISSPERGSVDKDQSAVCWGFVTFLVEHRPGSLGALLQFMGQEGKTSSRRGAVSSLTVERQGELIMELAGEDVFEQAGEFFRDGQRYDKRKRR